MSVSGLILLIVLIGISVYDFNVLKKSKIKISSCISSSLITLVVNVFLIFIGLLIGNIIFGDNSEYWILISLILVLSISYFRFRGREIKKGKVVDNKKKEKKITEKEKLKQQIENAASFGFMVTLVTFGLLFYLKTDNSAEYYFSFLDPILIGSLAFWTYKKLSFWGCLLMTIIFIIGKLIYIVPVYSAGGSGSAGIGMTVVISYFMIKGVIASYKLKNMKKIKSNV